jgi:hypothetical protein
VLFTIERGYGEGGTALRREDEAIGDEGEVFSIRTTEATDVKVKASRIASSFILGGGVSSSPPYRRARMM